MQGTMSTQFKIAGRVTTVIVSLFIAVLSSYAGWRYATIIAVVLLATNFLGESVFRKIFRASRLTVSIIGGVIWFVSVLLEI